MGNRKSRAISRPKDRGRPCTCDVFDVRVTYLEPVLSIVLTTDLPVNVRVAVLGQRTFREIGGHAWFWTAIEQNVPVQALGGGQNGFRLDVTVEELDTKGLHMYRQLKGQMDVLIGEVPTEELEISLIAPTTDHRFGICNRRLTGKAVVVRPGGHTVEFSTTVKVAPAASVMRRLGF